MIFRPKSHYDNKNGAQYGHFAIAQIQISTHSRFGKVARGKSKVEMLLVTKAKTNFTAPAQEILAYLALPPVALGSRP
ncbi:hypothetical protein MCP1_20020 [Candidatus Terasakiella magnetica]|nr:hypothetical protein MCP1_20020 [Candidatus Terasakiella magnetica]